MYFVVRCKCGLIFLALFISRIVFSAVGGLPIQINVDSDAPTLTLTWKFKLAFGFDDDDGFFLYTFPEVAGSEFQIIADFDWEIDTIDAKLLYFLDMTLNEVHIAFGAGVFVNIDKEKALRKSDHPNSVKYGRVSQNDFTKITNKKELFQINAEAAATLDVNDFETSVTIDPKVDEWIPSITGKIETHFRTGVNINRRREMKELDRSWLSSRITPAHHRGLRMLAEDGSAAALPANKDCTVDTSIGQFACARMDDISLDIGKIKPGIEKVMAKFVNEEKKGLFDEIVLPLLFLENEIPGLPQLTGNRLTPLDVAEIYVVESRSAVKVVRQVFEFYRSVRAIQEQVSKRGKRQDSKTAEIQID